MPGLAPVSRLTVPSGLERQPGALVFRNQQIGRSGCLHAGTRPLCRAGFAKDSEEPTGLPRSVDLPEAASYQLQGTALPKDGAALERLLDRPGADHGHGLVPGGHRAGGPARRGGRPRSRHRLGRGPRRPAAEPDLEVAEGKEMCSGLQFLSDPYLAASRPTEVSLRFDGGPPAR